MAENVKPAMAVEMRHLRYFVAVAEELSFRKAAERLFITQPALSHQIALLEATLGVRLFQRDRRRVTLTEEGKALLEDAARLLAQGDAMLLKARKMRSSQAAVLRVGMPEFANHTQIPVIYERFRAQHPEATLAIQEGYSRALLHDLRSGAIDLAFVVMPAADDLSGLDVEVILDEKSGLLLASDHALAGREEIDVFALAGVPLLLVDRPMNPALFDLVEGWLRGEGIEPRFFRIGGQGVYTAITAWRVVESGEAVSLGARSFGAELSPGVVYRPIRGPSPHFQLAAVWSPNNRSPLLGNFLRLTRQASDVYQLTETRH
jgi:DNA-binding transcriptional LysR family regulator